MILMLKETLPKQKLVSCINKVFTFFLTFMCSRISFLLVSSILKCSKLPYKVTHNLSQSSEVSELPQLLVGMVNPGG
jgi:hypothetical protein